MDDTPTALDVIEQAWFSIRNNYDRLRQAAPDTGALAKLKTDRDTAKAAYLDTLGKAFDESAASVKKGKADLKAAADTLDADLQDLQNIVAILKLVSSVVTLIGKIAALAG